MKNENAIVKYEPMIHLTARPRILKQIALIGWCLLMGFTAWNATVQMMTDPSNPRSHSVAVGIGLVWSATWYIGLMIRYRTWHEKQ